MFVSLTPAGIRDALVVTGDKTAVSQDAVNKMTAKLEL